MSVRSILAVAGATALGVAVGIPAGGAAAAADDPATSYIVQFTPGSDRAAEVSKAKGLGMKVTYEYTTALSGMAVLANKGQLTALQKNPNVKLIEADGIATINDTQNGATWGLDRTDQRNLPLSTTYTYTTTASNVTAYIIDTGINATHTEFGGRVSGGFTAFTDTVGTGDCNGHGTHVAGTVAGATYGMAKQAKLVPVRVLDCAGSGAWSGVIAGVDWVAANAAKPAVANMSLGGGAYSLLDTAVNNAVAAGVTMVVAAGNSNANACNSSPARAASAITVGATQSNDARASYSNYGSCLDIFAPGSSITSAWYTSDTALSTISGTSMASPHVAGAAALHLAANPTASPAAVTSALTTGATPNKVGSAGTGSPNLLLFVDSSGTPPQPVAPVINSLSPASGSVGASVIINGSGFTGANAVTFNGTPATFTVVSDSQISTSVPTNAVTGSVLVTSSAGTSAGVTFTVTVPVTVPAAPTGLGTVSVTRTGATVKWNSVPNATGYQVRLGTGTWVNANGTLGHTFSGLRKNTSYSWSVRALNGSTLGTAATSNFRTLR